MKTKSYVIAIFIVISVICSTGSVFGEWQRVSVGKYTNTAYDVCIDQNGNLLLTSYDNLQLRDKNGNWTVIPATDSLIKDIKSFIKTVIAHPDGKYYFCADKGLYSIENGNVQQVYMNFRQQAKDLDYDAEGNLWIAMSDSMVYKFDGKAITDSINWKALGDPYPTYYAQEIAIDYSGRMWRMNFDKLNMRDSNNKLILFDSTNSPFVPNYSPEFLLRNDKREVIVTSYEPSIVIMTQNGEWNVFKFTSLLPERLKENMRILCVSAENKSGDIAFFIKDYHEIADRGIFRFSMDHKLIKEYPKPEIIEIDSSSLELKYYPYDMDFDSEGNLYAVFNGILFKYIEDGVGVSETHDDFLEFVNVTPNPILDKGRVKFYTNPCNSERIKFALYDLYGRKVGDLKGEIKIDTNTGSGEIEIDAEQFCSGAYILTASIGEMSYTTKLIIQK